MKDPQSPIVDCHQHFIDARHLRYPLFVQRSAGFEAVVGDYSALPRTYLPEDYARDTDGLNVVKTVWAEFISDDPVGEVRWAEGLAESGARPNGMIARVDFLSPDLSRTLDAYGSLAHVRAVRQHLGWHPTNPLIRYAARPDLLADPAWRRGLGSIRGRDLVCELEVFSPQVTGLASVAAAYPDITFVLPAMGWPIDLTDNGRTAWRSALTATAACPNVRLKIFAMECIFGIRWTVPQVRPWILDAIGIFGPERCMFASHAPICKLACSLERLYAGYLEVIAGFSASEKRQLLHDTAATTYGI